MATQEDTTVKIPEDDLHALVDGRLAPHAAATMRARVDMDPQAHATVAAWQMQREALRGLYADIQDLPIPASLVASAERAERAIAQVSQWWRWGGIAATVLLAFGMGWLANNEWRDSQGETTVAKVEPVRHFAQQAAVAHVVFQPEVRHPVEVTVAQQEHLVQWLSKRLGRPLKVPVLAEQGYELMGGRLLPGDEGARAQFMYQNSAGQRLTLYLGALNQVPGSSATQETAFRFMDDGPVPGFYWVDQGFGYAIAGELPRATLQELASVVYRQL